MAEPSKKPKNPKDKSIMKWLLNLFPFLAKENQLGVNFNISAAMKTYRKLTKQKMLDSHYVNSELFESVMGAFDEIELENLEAQPSPSITNLDNQSDMVKDGEFTLIFSKKKTNRNLKNKSSKKTKIQKDTRQQALPNIVG